MGGSHIEFRLVNKIMAANFLNGFSIDGIFTFASGGKAVCKLGVCRRFEIRCI